jgi:UDP-N-acetylmuramoylalanine--D-glutamate ligase
MVVPEHLDWHTDMEEYVLAKQQLFRWQKKGDVAIYYPEKDNSKSIASAGEGKKIPYMKPPGAYVDNDFIKIDDHEICSVDELKLLGEHNWQNVCAAVTATWQVTRNPRLSKKF